MLSCLNSSLPDLPALDKATKRWFIFVPLSCSSFWATFKSFALSLRATVASTFFSTAAFVSCAVFVSAVKPVLIEMPESARFFSFSVASATVFSCPLITSSCALIATTPLPPIRDAKVSNLPTTLAITPAADCPKPINPSEADKLNPRIASNNVPLVNGATKASRTGLYALSGPSNAAANPKSLISSTALFNPTKLFAIWSKDSE